MATSDRRLVSRNFPYVPVRFEIRGQEQDIEALLDTGFNGALVIPAETLPGAPSPDLELDWRLANGSEVRAPAYLGSVRLGDFGPFTVLITLLGEQTLIGRGITDQLTLILDHGERVIVEP